MDRGAAEPGDRLLELVKEMLAAKDSVIRSLTINDSLTEAGVSSIDMVSLMLIVEAEFDIMIPASEITPENFRTISMIEALILRINPGIIGR